MTHVYKMTYAHGESDTPGTKTLQSETDAQALMEVRKFVFDGLRNSAWASLELSDGRTYAARNVRGRVMGQFTGKGG
jgi:hypothetical protein